MFIVIYYIFVFYILFFQFPLLMLIPPSPVSFYGNTIRSVVDFYVTVSSWMKYLFHCQNRVKQKMQWFLMAFIWLDKVELILIQDYECDIYSSISAEWPSSRWSGFHLVEASLGELDVLSGIAPCQAVDTGYKIQDISLLELTLSVLAGENVNCLTIPWSRFDLSEELTDRLPLHCLAGCNAKQHIQFIRRCFLRRKARPT